LSSFFNVHITTAEDTYQWTNDRHRTAKPGGTVSHGAYVDEDVYIAPSARVLGSATVTDHARIYGTALVKDDSIVEDNARVYGDARVSENATISGNARIYGDAHVSGNAIIKGEAKIFGNAHIGGDAVIEGDAIIEGYARIYEGEIKTGRISPPEPENLRIARETRQASEEAREAQEKAEREVREIKEKEMELFNNFLDSIYKYSYSRSGKTYGFIGKTKGSGFYMSSEWLDDDEFVADNHIYYVTFSYEDIEEFGIDEYSNTFAVKVVFKEKTVNYTHKQMHHYRNGLAVPRSETPWETKKKEYNYRDYLYLELPMSKRSIYEAALAYKNHVEKYNSRGE
jgi:carbonic anhydrase/acetyltransferase-like protein (isoleucine patch superfamily)